MLDKKLIVGNWKMNLIIHEVSLYVHKLSHSVKAHRNVEVVLAPGMLALPTLGLQVNRKQFKLAAQNFYWRDAGAYTGEVSAHQLNGLVEYALVGHSERRHIFHEHDKEIRAKVQAAFRNNIIPILCVGETAHERSENETNAVLHDQLVGGLANITAEEAAQMVIAYEPMWAIGAGVIPTPHDIESAVSAIRRQIDHLYGKSASQSVRILYGGSSTAANAATILSVKGVNGLLPGGASLKLDEFSKMVEIAHKSGKGKKA